MCFVHLQLLIKNKIIIIPPLCTVDNNQTWGWEKREGGEERVKGASEGEREGEGERESIP